MSQMIVNLQMSMMAMKRKNKVQIIGMMGDTVTMNMEGSMRADT